MKQFLFTKEPPQYWNKLCVSNADLFNDPEWHAVLSNGFGAETLYGWDEIFSTSITITIFKAGPFRIGYLGFPIGGMVGGYAPSPDIISVLREALFPVKLHCLRMPVSAFEASVEFSLPVQITLETAIEKLQEWRPETDAKLRQDINKAKRSSLQIIDATDASQGEALFKLYRNTVSRHGGSLRYTSAYFCALINLAKVHNGLRCLLAKMDDQLVGFEVVACHGQAAYSLHGCTNSDFKSYSPSDLLTYEAIVWAKKQGMTCYNLMASPHGRMSLVRYKEKWGGVTRQQKTYELALRPVQTMIFKAAASLYQRTSKFIRLSHGP